MQKMTELSKSPDKGTFQLSGLRARIETGAAKEDSYEDLLDFYKTHAEQVAEHEATDEFKTDNLEYDLRSTPWILDKVRTSRAYAQNLYASMCNTEFTKNDVWPILTEKTWHCSWRSAGGIVAQMRQEGDYIDWYCSGIRNNDDLDDDQFRQLTKEQQEFYLETKKFVGEGYITDDIRSDLLKLGWLVKEDAYE